MSRTSNTKDNVKSQSKPKKDPDGLHKGHRNRMKKRFIEAGFTGFTEHQIVELMLFYAYPMVDTNEKAHKLINKFGNIAGILDASYDDLTQDDLLTENAATMFKVILSIIPIYYNSKNSESMYDNLDKLKSLFEPYFIGLDHEEFRVACFDAKLRLNACILVNKGGPTGSYVDMRGLTEAVLKAKATSIAVAHNHPKASPLPSPDDIQVTQLINTVMSSIGIRFLDHIIVGENKTISMRERAFINFFD